MIHNIRIKNNIRRTASFIAALVIALNIFAAAVPLHVSAQKPLFQTGYTFDSADPLSDISGNSKYDAARANWGKNWRMPTAEEQQELLENCSWEWTTLNGVGGMQVTGPNGNSIFLPATVLKNNGEIN